MLFSLHQIIWKKMFFWTIKLIFVRILQSSIFGGYFDSFGKERWRKTMIENKNAQPAIQTLNLLSISTCDNKPPARTFSHNYVSTTESKSGPQLLSFFFAFCWLNVTRCDIIHSDISLLQMYVSNLNYRNVVRNIEKKIQKKNLAAQTNCWYYRHHWHKCQFSLCQSLTQSQFVYLVSSQGNCKLGCLLSWTVVDLLEFLQGTELVMWPISLKFTPWDWCCWPTIISRAVVRTHPFLISQPQHQICGGNFKLAGHVTRSVLCKDLLKVS